MTNDQAGTIEAIRQRYLGEYKRIHGKAARIAFFEEIGTIAASAGVSAWKTFSDGMIGWLQGNNVAALALFEQAIALAPEFAYPWNGKGNVLDDLKRYDEALAAYEKAISLEPEYSHPWNGKGNVLANLKRYDEALAAYEKAIALAPEYGSPWNGKGNVLANLKRYDESMAAYEKAISLEPESAYPWNGKGNALKNLDRYDEALAAYEKAISLEPEIAYPWNGKGNALKNLNRYDEALAAYEKAISLEPDFGYPWNGKGNALQGLNRYDDALAAYEKAISLAPEHAAEIHYNRGLLYWRKEDRQRAVEVFQIAIELGLEPEWESAAKSWIERAQRMIESEQAGESEESREKADRSSDEALVTDLFEALKDELPSIRKKKVEFKREMSESVGRPRIVGKSGADNMLLVLRDWNSFSPILRRELRGLDGPGPEERRGGGYFLMWKGHGIAIDPGVDFVTQLYRKGLSIADIDTVIITHCHLDHTRDAESLVDLNYRHNQALGFKPHPKNQGFRQLKFLLCYSAFMKYAEYLITAGCCRNPIQLERDGDVRRITNFIDVQAIPAEHNDINGRDDEAIGLVFVLKDENGPVARVGMTSDSRWMESLSESFAGCNVMVTHLGTIEVGEEPAPTTRDGEEANQGKDGDTGGFLKTDLKNHLGTKGCFRLLQQVKPKLFIVGEFGEELVETRFKILQVFHQLKPDETHLVLGGDSNLVVGLGHELSVCCSHPQCVRSWNRIPLDKVQPVLGGDFLFQYICSRHAIDYRGG